MTTGCRMFLVDRWIRGVQKGQEGCAHWEGVGPWRVGWSLTCLGPRRQAKGQQEQEQEWLHLSQEAAQVGATGASSVLLAPRKGRGCRWAH